mgnify:CR=1 FL=1
MRHNNINIHEQNKDIDECDYDIIVSEFKNIRIRYQLSNSFYEIETAHREEDVGDIYSNIKLCGEVYKNERVMLKQS